MDASRHSWLSRSRAAQVALLLAATGLLAACGRSGEDERAPIADNGVRQTGFPGQITAGGPTGGEVIARNSAGGGANREQGTPGIPQGAGGNTGGPAMGGTTQGTSSLAGEGAKAPAQQPALPPAGTQPGASAPASR